MENFRWVAGGIILTCIVIWVLIQILPKLSTPRFAWPTWADGRLFVIIFVIVVSYWLLEGWYLPVFPNWLIAILLGVATYIALRWPGQALLVGVIIVAIWFFGFRPKSHPDSTGNPKEHSHGGENSLVLIGTYEIVPGAGAVTTVPVKDFEIFTDGRAVEVMYSGTEVFIPYSSHFDGDADPTFPPGAHAGVLKIKSGKGEKSPFQVKLYKIEQ